MTTKTPETEGLTFGQRAVGLTFNPSGDPKVDAVKQAFADVIDTMNELREDNPLNKELARLASIAITDTQTAQMWCVKSLTWGK